MPQAHPVGVGCSPRRKLRGHALAGKKAHVPMQKPLPESQLCLPPRQQRIAAALTQLVESLGMDAWTDARTIERASALWDQTLVPQTAADPLHVLGKGTPSSASGPIVVKDLGFFLVCPHHLTVATGHADIAYWPDGRVVGFGRLTQLLQACCARPVLQEDAGFVAAQSLWHGLGARAVAVRLTAVHPCHATAHPQSHAAEAQTWALAGDAALSQVLMQQIGVQDPDGRAL